MDREVAPLPPERVTAAHLLLEQAKLLEQRCQFYGRLRLQTAAFISAVVAVGTTSLVSDGRPDAWSFVGFGAGISFMMAALVAHRLGRRQADAERRLENIETQIDQLHDAELVPVAADQTVNHTSNRTSNQYSANPPIVGLLITAGIAAMVAGWGATFIDEGAAESSTANTPSATAQPSSTAAPSLDGGPTLRIEVSGLVPDGSDLRLEALDSPEAWQDPSRPVASIRARVHQEVMQFFLQGLKPDRIAIRGYQDRNGNGVLDKNLLGIPTEGWGFSGTAKLMRPPTFEDAAFDLAPSGATATIVIR